MGQMQQNIMVRLDRGNLIGTAGTAKLHMDEMESINTQLHFAKLTKILNASGYL